MTKPDELTREQLIADMKRLRETLLADPAQGFEMEAAAVEIGFIHDVDPVWVLEIVEQVNKVAFKEALAATDRPEYKEVE